jgi:hypothetical protein
MTPVYMTDSKESYVLKKLQRGLNGIETWCEHWNIKFNQDKTQAIYFSHRLRPPEAHLTLNGQNIPFINYVGYLGVIIDRTTWRLHIEMSEKKAFRTFTRIYSILKSERLSAIIKLTLYKALIGSIMTYACSAWELAEDTYLLKLQRMQNTVLRTSRNFPRRTPVRDLHTAFNIPCV